MKIVVIDYQVGNISSIINMLKRIGVTATYTASFDDIKGADKLILPGVGAFDHGMQNLQASGLIQLLNEEVLQNKKPILGICLGMQLLLNKSEEGQLPGLGWIKGRVAKFNFSAERNSQLKVPHMGWNVVKPSPHNPLLKMSEAETRFYFVHSYHALCDHAEDILGITHYGYDFPAMIGRDHIMGAQFHPEKSHRFGLQLLKNFIEYEG